MIGRCLAIALAVAISLCWTMAFGQDDRMLLQAGAASFRVPVKYPFVDYREGGVDEPIPVRWFGFNFWLSDRAPVGKDEKRQADVMVHVFGIEAKPPLANDKRFLPANRIWATITAPLLYDYTKVEEFGLEKHEYCGLDARQSECPTVYISQAGTSPQVYTHSPYERMPTRDRLWTFQVYYPEDRIVYWLTLPESALPRWKAAADGAIELIRSWRVP
jgi:hypothetical protein